jgi:hypothetical protein
MTGTSPTRAAVPSRIGAINTRADNGKPYLRND